MMRWAPMAMVLVVGLAGCSDDGGGGDEAGPGDDDGLTPSTGINETIPLIEYPIQRIEDDTSLGFTFDDANVLIVRLQADNGFELNGFSYSGDEGVGWGYMILEVEEEPDLSDPCRPLDGIPIYHTGFGQFQTERGTGFYDLWIWGEGAVTLDFNGQADAPVDPIVYRSDWAFSTTTQEVPAEGPPAAASFELDLSLAAPGVVLARWEPPNGLGVQANSTLAIEAGSECDVGADAGGGGGFGGGDALQAAAIVPAGTVTVVGDYSETGHSFEGGEARVVVVAPAAAS